MRKIKDLQIAIHFDHSLIDEKDKDVVIDKLKEALWLYFETFNILMPKGTFIYVGNGYEFFEVISHIIDIEKKSIIFAIE